MRNEDINIDKRCYENKTRRYLEQKEENSLKKYAKISCKDVQLVISVQISPNKVLSELSLLEFPIFQVQSLSYWPQILVFFDIVLQIFAFFCEVFGYVGVWEGNESYACVWQLYYVSLFKNF